VPAICVTVGVTTGAGSQLGDIYQLGFLFYRAVNGDQLYEKQFVGIDDATMERLIIAGRLPNRRMFLPHVPQRVRTIIRKAMRTNPAERYQSADEFSRAIAHIPPSLDWMATIQPTGEMMRQAKRTGKADLEVQLQNSRGAWSVSVSRVKGASNGTSTLSRSGLSIDGAITHLNDVFGQLE